ncbi:DegQ family serine endoprotease [Polyangium sp. y55x31]|uniref:DegQ family serine endoprotease n=1 Tax=Polyangium sp. y55x31 TaxID=3042688 RepID=UPI0024825CBA|nr:DegQ family serine endoprotease [Polyangium sp. y55x31]MDI1480639.1 DegQ family serine endoprotease [Polyangium sp. y55x31]
MNVRRLSKLGATALLILAAGCQRSPEAQAVTRETTAAGATAAPSSTPPVLSGTPDVAALVARVQPSVVNITSEHEVEVPRDMPGDPFGGDSPFGWFFGPNRHGRRPPVEPFERGRKQQALGSGILIDAAGHVVTNAHVVEDADVVRVKLADDREFKAKVKGRDPQLDLAVLELEGAKDLPAATLGSSAALRVGEYVIAIGNPFGLGHTVTMGIVSAKSRTIGAGPYDDFIQTDASINPGNSGGPLFNLRGEVVGINTAINPNGKGIGFAIPIDDVKDVLPQLLGTGHVARGRLGVVIQPVDAGLAKAFGLDRPRGALIAEVEPDGPAQKAGLQSGDVIVEVDGTEVQNAHDLPRMVARHAPGSKVKVKVLRKGETKTFEATLAALADEQGKGAAPSGPSVDSSGLGAELMDAPDGGGAVVRRVRPGSAADEALAPGDVIVEVDRAPVKNAAEASEQIGRALKKGPALLRIERDGRGLYVVIESTSPR